MRTVHILYGNNKVTQHGMDIKTTKQNAIRTRLIVK